jgi:hypothetical protein
LENFDPKVMVGARISDLLHNRKGLRPLNPLDGTV